MRFQKTILLALAMVAWLGAIAAGFAALQRYETTEGPALKRSADAHEIVSQHRKPGRALVIMSVHPRCPCTTTSLSELGDLLARSHGTCDALLLEYEPMPRNEGWPKRVPFRELGGVRVPVVSDPGSKLAAALGARTSGHVVFVDATGAVRFEGGLTLSRGHRGRSPAQTAILAMLRNEPSALPFAPVYGCALQRDCAPDSAP